MKQRRYQNPILPGFHPDPSICRVGGEYYLVNSSFEYFPGLPIYESRDLVHWRGLGGCLNRADQLPLERAAPSQGLYAPTIRYHEGTFYIVCTNVGGGGHFIVTARDPQGPWSDPIWLEGNGIDPSLFFDDNGTIFFTWTDGESILQSELDVETGRRLTPPREIWRGTGGAYPEGPHLFKAAGRYYLLIAEGGTEYGHMITAARSNSPWGPWEACPHNPILSHRSLRSEVQGVGHGDMIRDEHGNWWIVFLGFRPKSYTPTYNLGRETFLAPVKWDQDGWFSINNGNPVSLDMEGPLPDEWLWEPDPLPEDFVLEKPGPVWCYLRNPVEKRYDLSTRPGWLGLWGGPETLDEAVSPTFLARRQEHINCTITAQLDFNPTNENEEAGLTAYMNPGHHYDLGLTRRNNRRVIFVRRRIGKLAAVVLEREVPEGLLNLAIRADEENYVFGFAPVGETIQWLDGSEGERRYLSTEVAGGFTGVMLGMYASGNGAENTRRADFDWFEYRAA